MEIKNSGVIIKGSVPTLTPALSVKGEGLCRGSRIPSPCQGEG